MQPIAQFKEGMAGQSVKEADVARDIVAWLQDQRWTVYQEVQLDSYSPVVDIVAVQGNLTWIVEVKTSLSLKVIEQARFWIRLAHYVSVGVPEAYRDSRGTLARDVLDWLGIGCLERSRWPDGRVRETLSPRLGRHGGRIKKYLMEEQKTFAEAGNPDSKRYSPFQDTCFKVMRAVHRRPGLTLAQLLDSIDTHYSNRQTARSCIPQWIYAGVIKGVRIEKIDRRIHLFPDNSKRG